MKNRKSHFTDVMYKIIRIGVVIGILAAITGYYIDISKRDTIVIQGIPEHTTPEFSVSESSVPVEAVILPEELSLTEYAVQPETTSSLPQSDPIEAVVDDIVPEAPASTPPEPAYSTTATASTTKSSVKEVTELQNADPQPVRVESTQGNALININTAPASELMQLDGIGEVRAQAIVQYREEHGSFKSLDELVNVKGIGEKTLEKNREKITV